MISSPLISGAMEAALVAVFIAGIVYHFARRS